MLFVVYAGGQRRVEQIRVEQYIEVRTYWQEGLLTPSQSI